jgi:peptidyl-prolyl cis-trans isomerase A (cyclophilin A)
MIALFLLLLQTGLPQPPELPPADGPVVVLETSLGEIRIGLYAAKAPRSTENFLAYVRAGHYTGTVFHRVMPGFMIQGGGYDAQLNERETRPPVRSEARNHNLDFGIGGAGYTVFGRVLEGMDVVDRIAAVPTSPRGPHEAVPLTPVTILSARVVEPAAAAPVP